MRRRAGVTLLEMVLSLALLSASILALTDLFPSSALMVRRSGQHLQGEALALSMISDFRNTDWKTLAVGEVAQPDVVMDGVIYHRKLKIWAPDGDPTKLLAAKATVNWMWVRGPQDTSMELYRASLKS